MPYGPARGETANASPRPMHERLLDLDDRTLVFELLLDLGGLVLVDAFLDGLAAVSYTHLTLPTILLV